MVDICWEFVAPDDHKGCLMDENPTKPPSQSRKWRKLLKGCATILGQKCLVREIVAPYNVCAKLSANYDETSINVKVGSGRLSEE